jgi:hypothetical protein
VPYYDREPLADDFGENAMEQMLDDMDGLGPAIYGHPGRLDHRDTHRESRGTQPRRLDGFTWRAPGRNRKTNLGKRGPAYAETHDTFVPRRSSLRRSS